MASRLCAHSLNIDVYVYQLIKGAHLSSGNTDTYSAAKRRDDTADVKGLWRTVIGRGDEWKCSMLPIIERQLHAKCETSQGGPQLIHTL